jgi:hypothetical protein
VKCAPFLSPKVLSQQHQCEPRSWVNEISDFSIFQAELCLDLKKFCTGGWNFLLIQKTDSMTSGAFVMKPPGSGSYVMSDLSNGRPHPALYGSKALLEMRHLPYTLHLLCIADFDLALGESATKHDYPGGCGKIPYLPPEAILALDDTDLTYRRYVTIVIYLEIANQHVSSESPRSLPSIILSLDWGGCRIMCVNKLLINVFPLLLHLIKNVICCIPRTRNSAGFESMLPYPWFSHYKHRFRIKDFKCMVR